jgi:hypothetical protein
MSLHSKLGRIIGSTTWGLFLAFTYLGLEHVEW